MASRFAALVGLLLLAGGLPACGSGAPPDSESGAPLVSQRPNVLLIVADDLGYTDIGAFGGEIATPNLDRLAEQGVSFTRFYTSMACSPTRAMLLTGVDNHAAGLGNMAEFLADNQRGKLGYEGALNDRVYMVAELLSAAGYRTYMSGKWHLGYAHEQSPRARGFDRSFALLDGAASHFGDRLGADPYRNPALYREDGELLDELPGSFYSSDYYADKMIEYLSGSDDSDSPFFAYLAFTAPHWPLQAPSADLAKQRGRYDGGYDVIRNRRLERIRDRHLLTGVSDRQQHPLVVPWADLSPGDQQAYARVMEVYAAMVENMDANIGRVLAALESSGELDNTLVIFLSDNGADGFDLDIVPAFAAYRDSFDNRPSNIGLPNSLATYGASWAQVGEAPFQLFKGFMTEGGMRSPAIVRFPGRGASGSIYAHMVTVMDIVPTILDLAGVDAIAAGADRLPPSGRSFLAKLRGDRTPLYPDELAIGFELWGQRAVYRGAWKLRLIPEPLGSGQWELYDVVSDPGESVNHARSEPRRVESMVADWERYAVRYGVILPDGWQFNPPGGRPTR